jgi:hypothetical protein
MILDLATSLLIRGAEHRITSNRHEKFLMAILGSTKVWPYISVELLVLTFGDRKLADVGRPSLSVEFHDGQGYQDLD